MLIKSKFQSTKLIDGFSTVFRQHSAKDTHCKFLHGYSISFRVIFEGKQLDDRNWVVDFGFMKRSQSSMYLPTGEGVTPEKWFKYMFDHTVIVSQDDPELESFQVLDKQGVIQLRVLPKVGCEMFAMFVFNHLNEFIEKETDGRVRVCSVECFEHSKNSAIYTSEKF